ncbi:MAG: HD domain-containing protein [Candidatus Heimdallarchaeota archaeon]|nr:HD domain-containing protein [Candidatus Heimdallarchaeota archaeon]MDH5646193.1 HD domain-containing protein [Candidatus Heimdallarchaeota archaeon]
MKYSNAIRDPIHTYIRLTDEEMNLLDSPFLQRLRWISQLSGVRLVFPGAQHSRLAHVLGVMHLAGEYAEQVFQDYDDKDHRVQLARLGGLLHDVGHGPFSHAYDDTVYRLIYPGNPHGHDTHRFKMIKHPLLKPVIEACGITVGELKALWEGKDPVMQAITQGALGADRMDFMLRDAYFSGTTHFGSIAVKRIIDNALISEYQGTNALHYHIKVLEDIFQSLLGRFYMYRGVYFHKASAAADIMIRKMLHAAKLPLNLAERTKNLEEYQWINEYTLMGEIMSSKDEKLEEAKYYCKRLMSRDLPKLVWEATMSENQITAISGNLEEDSKTIAHGRIINKINEEAKKKKIDEPQVYITNTYPMSTIDNQEFQVGQIYIYDKNKSLEENKTSHTLQEAIEKTTYFRSFLSGVKTSRERYVMIRVYTDAENSKWIKEYINKTEKPTKTPSIAETSY